MAVRGIVYSPGPPLSRRAELGSNASLPETLLQTPGPDQREPSIISELANTVSMRGDYVVTPIKSRRARRPEVGPYSTRDVPTVRRLQETRRRNIDTAKWSKANSRGSDVPPANWFDDPGPRSTWRDAPERPRREPVKYVGRDPYTGQYFVESVHGNRKVLGQPPPRSDNPHPRRGNRVKTETISGTIKSDPPRYSSKWVFLEDPIYQSAYREPVRVYRPPVREYIQPVREYIEPDLDYRQRMEYRPPVRVYSRRLSDVPVKGSIGDKDLPSSGDSVENFKGSDIGPREPKKGEFVPHWGYYVETPPSPGQSIKPRQGSVLDPNYRPRDNALDRDLLSPRSLSQSMVPTHGSTLTTPSERGSEKGGSDESGFDEPVTRYQGGAYDNNPNDYASPEGPYQRGPGGPGPQAFVVGRGVNQRPIEKGINARGGREFQARNVKFGEAGAEDRPRGLGSCDVGYLCTVSGVLKLVEFVVSTIIAGITRADPTLWTLHVFILFVGVSGMVLSLVSFIFRLFHWEQSAHVGCLWFEFSCYLVVALLMFTAAIMSTISASVAVSIVALTFFCYLGAGLFTADTLLTGNGIAKRNFQDDQDKPQDGNQGQQRGPNQGKPGGGYPGGPRQNPTYPSRR